jgi:ankyrin repeat protein
VGREASAAIGDVGATIKTLIARGAALDLKDDRGETAADIAPASGARERRSLWNDETSLGGASGSGSVIASVSEAIQEA